MNDTSYMPIILDKDFKILGVCDTFKSLIWTDRFRIPGDFEMTLHPNDPILKMLTPDRYLITPKSEHFMIIEGSELSTDAATGEDMIIISGRSGESITTRRIIWGQAVYYDTELAIIQSLINREIISASDVNRRISNFIFKNELPSSYATRTKIEAQFTGDYLSDALKSICDSADIGFKIIFDDNYNFVFSPYTGEDRSYRQTVNPYVVFSPAFDNLKGTKYLNSNKTLKTTALIGGEGEGNARRYTSIVDPSYSGLYRRELFVDARDISSDVDGGKLTNEQYIAQLKQRGNEKLSDKVNKVIQEVSADIITTENYQYGRDFFMGDIVQVVNQYGVEVSARIVEMIHTEDDDGIINTPSFTII